MQYSDFFKKATGRSPFPYQDAVAQRVELPSIIQAPTGSGKTAAVILGWLWRRFHPHFLLIQTLVSTHTFPHLPRVTNPC